ncbi:MAG: DNA internalization-related competence protein ComEC/Rec2 [Defluviitaleaceae bacterium]|nr:DNA internalization-related competence protein ComEC/Rec2 [Defluviitaleaceae bacterium]
MKRPLLVSLIFLCAGIITGTFFANSFLFSLVFVIFLSVFFYKIYGTKMGVVFCCVFIVGYFSLINSISPQNAIIDDYVNKGAHFLIEGRVTAIDMTRTGRQRITLRTQNFYVNNTHISETMIIQALLSYDQYANIGQQLEIQGNLLPLSRPSTPGQFDQFQFLRARGVQYTIFPVIVHFGQTNITLASVLQDFRHRLIAVFDNNLPPMQASVMRSVVLGDRSSMDPEVLDTFRTAGLYHILVVSGLHLSILFLAINKLLDKFFNQKTSALLTLGIIVLFGLMIGGVSVARAGTMAGVMVFSRVLYRERDFITSISFAAFILLLYQPLFLFDAGFLLSFGAVYGIAVGTEPVERLLFFVFRVPILRRLLKYQHFMNHFAVNVAVFLTLAPIFAYFFFHIMTYSIFANIIVILSGKILVILGFVVAVVGLVAPGLSFFLSGGLYFLVTVYYGVASFFHSLPNALTLIGRPSIIEIIAYYAVLASLFLLFSSPKPRPIYRASFAVCLAGFLVLVGMGDGNMRVTFLDVGQGEAIVIRLNNQTYIIDGGGHRHREIGENTGMRVLIPYLQYRGINHINAIFVTHEDADHIIGIIELLNYSNKRVDEIYTTPGLDKDYELSYMLLRAAERDNIPVSFINSPTTFFAPNAVLEVIFPFDDTFFRDPNSTSLVLRLTYGNVSFLFTGDIDQISEREILSKGKDVRAHVLNVAHHGSRFSSYHNFVYAVDPLVAIVSAGANNPFGHPTQEVVSLFYTKRIPMYNTADVGTIIVTTDGNEINLYTHGGRGNVE